MLKAILALILGASISWGATEVSRKQHLADPVSVVFVGACGVYAGTLVILRDGKQVWHDPSDIPADGIEQYSLKFKNSGVLNPCPFEQGKGQTS
jgi:hypothetical protein